jgi:hypothetical protein
VHFSSSFRRKARSKSPKSKHSRWARHRAATSHRPERRPRRACRASGCPLPRRPRPRAPSQGRLAPSRRPAPRDPLGFVPCCAPDRPVARCVGPPIHRGVFPCASYHGHLIAVLRRARASPIKGRHPYLAHLTTAVLPRLASPPTVSSAPPPSHSPTRVRRRASKPTPSLARTQHPQPACRPGRAAHSPERVLQRPADHAAAEPPRRLWSRTLRAQKPSPGDLQAIPRPRSADPAAEIRPPAPPAMARGHIARSAIFLRT